MVRTLRPPLPCDKSRMAGRAAEKQGEEIDGPGSLERRAHSSLPRL